MGIRFSKVEYLHSCIQDMLFDGMNGKNPRVVELDSWDSC